MNTTGKDFLEHWSRAGNKGLMNKNTAVALKNACTKVLSYIDGWDTVDVTTLDVEDTLNRFQNLSAKDLRPDSLSAYKRRFRHAIQSYKEYIQNPSGWKPTSEQSKPKQLKPRNSQKKLVDMQHSSLQINQIATSNLSPSQGLVEYPFPLREDLVITIRLPKDLKLIEVKRITAFMKILTIDYHLEEE